MRKYPFYILFLLISVLFTIDVIVFTGIVQYADIFLKAWVKWFFYTGYWAFSILLYSFILYLTFTFPEIHSEKYRKMVGYIMAATLASFLPKLIFSLFHLIGFIFEWIYAGAVIFTFTGLVFSLIALSYVLHGVLWGRHSFKVYKHTLEFKTLPSGFDGFKIVHISDLHIGSFSKKYGVIKKAVKQINDLQPDIICFTGDIVNHHADETIGWESILQDLRTKTKMFAVLGNHDYGDYHRWPTAKAKTENLEKIKGFLNKIGFRLLLNQSEVLQEQGDKIAVVGIENWGKPPFQQYGDLKKAMEKVNSIEFKILLSHDPSHWDEEVLSESDVNLTLSGHTHGMQFGFGYGRKKWSPSQLKYPRWGGLYKEGDQYLYVNRGLGYHAFPGRINMPPEITLLELRKLN